MGNIKHLHGKAEDKNIVLGISDLNDNLRQYKIFSFVKTYQKLINNTDYLFLDEPNIKVIKNPNLSVLNEKIKCSIVIWGHSLDISDEEYIKEIFDLNKKTSLYLVKLEVWYHTTPHEALANLMNIMGKDIIQKWMKEGWLVFEAAPNIYEQNNKAI